MPSPIGHGVIGLSVALLAVPKELLKPWLLKAFWVIFLACLPDVDLVFGLLFGDLNQFHRAATHSITFALVAAGIVYFVSPFKGQRGFLILFAAACSHLVADLFGIDPTPPIGIQLCWPFVTDHFMAPFTFFPALSKETLGDMFQWANLIGLLKEFAYVFPLFLVSLYCFKTQNK